MTDVQRRGSVYGKRPATIVRQEPRAVYVADQYDYHQLVARVADLEKAGRIKRARREPIWNADTRQWAIPVHRLKEPPSPWRKRLLIGVPVLAVMALVVYALHTLASAVVLAALFSILTLFVGGVAKAHSGRTVEVTTTTTVRVRG